MTVVACSPAKSRARNEPIAPTTPGSLPRSTFSSGVKANRSGRYSESPCTTACPAAAPGATLAFRCSPYSPSASPPAIEVRPVFSAVPTAFASGTPALVSARATPAPVNMSGTADSRETPAVEAICCGNDGTPIVSAVSLSFASRCSWAYRVVNSLSSRGAGVSNSALGPRSTTPNQRSTA